MPSSVTPDRPSQPTAAGGDIAPHPLHTYMPTANATPDPVGQVSNLPPVGQVSNLSAPASVEQASNLLPPPPDRPHRRVIRSRLAFLRQHVEELAAAAVAPDAASARAAANLCGLVKGDVIALVPLICAHPDFYADTPVAPTGAVLDVLA